MNQRAQKPTAPQGKRSVAAAAKRFRTAAKVALLTRGWTIGKLADQVKRPRETVSRAINQFPRFPLVRGKIEEALGIK